MIIPEIPPVLQEVSDAAKSGKLVIFIGAGVSRLAGGPSWGQLADRLLKELAKQNIDFSYGDLEQLRSLNARTKISIATDICKQKGVELPFKSILQPNDQIKEIPKIYEDLYNMDVCFITTNFDDYMDRLAEKHLPAPIMDSSDISNGEDKVEPNEVIRKRVYYRKEELTNEKLLTRGNVIHLHGSVRDSGTMVMSTRQYLEHYQDEYIDVFLKRLFGGEFTVVFIGYGLEENEILEHMIRKRPPTQDSKIKYLFRLFPIYSYQKNLYELLDNYYKNNCCTYLVPYSTDNYGYKQLENIIGDWSGKIKQVSRDPGFFEKVKILDEALNE